MNYDRWKENRYRGSDDPPEDDEPECGHPYWNTRFAFLTGKATCGECGTTLPWCEPLPFFGRLREAYGDLCWWARWTARPAIKRPFRAVRRWWRGYRNAPWKPDNEIPF